MSYYPLKAYRSESDRAVEPLTEATRDRRTAPSSGFTDLDALQIRLMLRSNFDNSC